MLTDRDVQQYRDEGYLHLKGVLDAGEVAELRTACEQASVRRDLTARGYEDKIVFLHPLTTKHPGFKALAADRRIVDRVAQLLGPDLQIQQSKLATKPPKAGKGEFSWHQDFAFHPHTNTDLLAAFVMLDDCTLENGCLHVIPKSHKLGLLNHSKDGSFTAACQDAQHFSDPSKFLPLQGRAGDITIHHTLTLHASFNNISGRARRGLIYEYRAADAYQLDGRVFEDTGWQVAGQDRAQVRCEAGVLNLARRKYVGHEFDTALHQTGPSAREWSRHTCGATV